MYESDSPDLIFTRDPPKEEESLEEGPKTQEAEGEGCKHEHPTGKREPLGNPLSWGSQTLNVGGAAFGNFSPVNKICQHICAFHFYAHDMTRQVEAHHYCSHLNDDMRQCLIYDSDQPNARLIGVEYIISESLFQTLHEEERVFWHSHEYEVMSGILYCPHMPDALENQMMKKLVNTYGKTWHLWQVDRGDPLPYGPAQLMMALKRDGMANEDMVQQRDTRYNKWTDKVRASREAFNIEPPKEILAGADSWDKPGGKALQVKMVEVEMKRKVD